MKFNNMKSLIPVAAFTLMIGFRLVWEIWM